MSKNNTLSKTNRDVALEIQCRLISAALEDKGWSQADLARATGLPDYTVSRVSNGRTLANPETAQAIAHALDLDPSALGPLELRLAPRQMADGIHRHPLENGKVQFSLSAQIEPGLARLIETLMDYDQPIGSARMSLILNAMYAPLPVSDPR